ncbi:MAG: hypothetical protein Q9173_000453 [Seirophora scorigena]
MNTPFQREKTAVSAYSAVSPCIYKMIQKFNSASDAAYAAGGSSCSICHDTLVRGAAAAESAKLAMNILACGHMFHEYCLMHWLSPIQFVDDPPPSTNTEQQPREAIGEVRPRSASPPSPAGDHRGRGEASEEEGSLWHDIQRRARRLEQLLDRFGLLQDPPQTSVLAQRILDFIGENRRLIGRLHGDGDDRTDEEYIGMWRQLLAGMEVVLGVDDAELVAQEGGGEMQGVEESPTAGHGTAAAAPLRPQTTTPGTLPRYYGYETIDEPEEGEILEMESLTPNPNPNRNSRYTPGHPSPSGLLSALAALDPRTREEAETGDDGLEEGEIRETESPAPNDPAESASREEVEASGSRLLEMVREAFSATSEDTQSDINAEENQMDTEGPPPPAPERYMTESRQARQARRARASDAQQIAQEREEGRTDDLTLAERRSEESLEDGEIREADEVEPADPHVSDSQYLPPVDLWDGSIMDPGHGPTARDTSGEPTTQSSRCPLCRKRAFDRASRCCSDTLRLIRVRLRLTNLAYGIFGFERGEVEDSERAAITAFLQRRYSDSVVLDEESPLPSAPECRRIFTAARDQLRNEAYQYLYAHRGRLSAVEQLHVMQLVTVFEHFRLQDAHMPLFFGGDPSMDRHEWRLEWSAEQLRAISEHPEYFFAESEIIPRPEADEADEADHADEEMTDAFEDEGDADSVG